ncbi:MAG: serine/threonine protein kinase [Myxococcales bacterium]|nr:serine/threonine protein kinase [Myxococcales bacterium]
MALVVREWHLDHPRATHDLAVGSVIGRYQIEGPLGAGAMGVVYRAFDPVVARHVALKLIHVDGFADSAVVLRKAQAMGQVNHPAVVRIYDAGVTDAQVYVAMELVEGRTLRAAFAEQARSPRAWYVLFASIAEGLAAAHDAGVVHRDFKPENVLVARDGTAKVTDFGLARVNASSNVPLTPALGTQAAGTPAYMAPEQLAGESSDARSDQYSFGIVLYEALKGSRPIVASSLEALSSAMQSPNIDWANITKGARTILTRTLAYDPHARFTSMHDVARELRKLAAPARWPWAVGAVASVGLGIGVMLAPRAGPSADPCAEAGVGVSAAWTPAQAAQLERSYAATQLPYAVHAGGTARRTLDEYATKLRAGYSEACRATHVERTQSPELLDRRAQCLDRCTSVLAATGALLERADADLVLNTTQALAKLTDVRACADRTSLADEVPPPADPLIRGRIEAIRRQLAEAGNATVTTRYPAGLALAAAAATAASEVGYRPLEAEAWFTLGSLQYAVRSTDSARATLERAALAAVAGRSRLIEAQIRERLSQVLGLTLHDVAEGQRQLDLGLALLETMQGSEATKIQLFTTQGAMLSARGDHAGALALHQRSLAMVGQADRGVEAELEQLIADELIEMERANEALPLLERSAAAVRELVGEQHPTFAAILESMANAYQESDPAKAIELMLRAHAIYARVWPAESSRFAVHEANVGGLLLEYGRVDEALPYLRRALGTVERTLPPEHPAHARLLVSLGKALQHEQQFAEAAPLLESALAIFVAQGLPTDETAELEFALAQVLWARRPSPDRARVLELLDRSERGLKASGGDERATAITRWRREQRL